MTDVSDPATMSCLPVAFHGWQFVILAEVANFAMLRRHVGRARADTLVGDIALRIAAVLPQSRTEIAARDLIDIALLADQQNELDLALELIAHAFTTPFDIDGELYHVDLTLGGASVRAPQHDEVRLIEEAELALADARVERGPIARDVSAASASLDRLMLARELHKAIGGDQLFLQYQPKVHLRRQEIVSVEALVRWRHPQRGLVLPSDFIPIAEESRDIVALTLWTIGQVIGDQRILAAHGHELPIFINIAGVLLADARFVRQACEMITSSGARLGFEITETSVIRDPDSAIRNLQIFADIGIVIAIDDYGAGLSSLAYLKQLPASELKIDKLFVTQLTSSNRDPLIVRSTIDLAHALEMEVVAEGVETPSAMALLSVMGCDMIQGFLVSRPIGIDALLPFLAEERHLAIARDVRSPLTRIAAVRKTG
ncbi:EAL domain-containing protein [Sphingomonas aerolata]|uniref:EAL domain-containing protein n=1 Tax=Sphingomonas aerolata TaxID=185951 RepID=UPI00334F1F5A